MLSNSIQHLLPTGFGHFENLYFNGKRRTFFTLGEKICLNKAIYTREARGYVWLSHKKIPPALMKRGCTQVSGVTIMLFERAVTPEHYSHFFHALEHLLGLWNFGGESMRHNVKLFLIASNGEMDSSPFWKGPNDVTFHLIQALFPHATIKLWADFVRESKEDLLCFEKVLTSDRCMEYLKKEPYRTDRMLGGYFEHLSKESTDRLAHTIRSYVNPLPKPHDKLIVTYVKRPPPRTLTPALETKLLSTIEQLPHISLHIVDFASLPFKEQIPSHTDVLLGVHGNGLSHTLFLPTGATLIELFPPHSFRAEYRILAKVRHLNYFGFIQGSGWIDDKTIEQKGSFGEVATIPITDLDIDAIVTILDILRNYNSLPLPLPVPLPLPG